MLSDSSLVHSPLSNLTRCQDDVWLMLKYMHPSAAWLGLKMMSNPASSKWGPLSSLTWAQHDVLLGTHASLLCPNSGWRSVWLRLKDMCLFASLIWAQVHATFLLPSGSNWSLKGAQGHVAGSGGARVHCYRGARVHWCIEVHGF